MNILQAKEEIRHSIEAYLMKDDAGQYKIPVLAQRPILLMGPPGIGKTAVMEQIAKECGVGLVAYTMTHHTRQSAIGLPMIEKHTYGGRQYSATEYTMSEIIGAVYDTMARTKKTEGILFLDEINCVSETLAPTMLQFLQKKMFGNHRVPDGWIIVAAGNPPEYNKSVREFDIVTLDRVRRIDITEDFSVWKRYAYERGVHPSIISYLEIKKDHFYQIETTAAGKRFVTARGWEDLSYMIYAGELMALPLSEATVGQYVQHPKIAKDFANYYDLYLQYKDDYHVNEIFDGTIRPQAVAKIREARFDEKISLIGLLMGRLNGDFKAQQRHNDFVEQLYDVLIALKELETRDGGGQKENPDVDENADVQENPHVQKMDAFAALLSEKIDSLDEKENAMEIKELYTYLNCVNAGGGFKGIKTLFEAQVDTLGNLTDMAQAHLNAAFDFMEAAFGESQEMVIFITELNTSSPATRFIGQNGCDRYYKYNEGLLFASGRDRMLKELESITPYMDFLGI